MMSLKRYNLAAVLLLLLGGYGSAQAAIAPDRTRLVFRGEDKSISVDLKNANSKLPYLAQSWVEDEKGVKITSPLIVVPPVQRIEPSAIGQVKIQGMPALASSHIVATTFITNETYSPPDTRSSVCPKVPVDTFDISWDANVSKQKTTLMLDATGGTVNRTLHTYLMEGGKLCDGSKFDNRGAYCRFVSSGITLNVLGCDQSSVTTSAVDHPITDVELHDINVAVNTRNIGSGQFTSTCSFQYIIDEL